jgi:nucleotide-binding universal stress UspA family protein
MKILVALDTSDYAEIVLEHAIDQAIHDKAPEIHFLTVADRRADIEAVKNHLATLVLPALEGLSCADWKARIHVRTGDVADEIATLALDVDADLVVVGRFGVHRRRHSLAEKLFDQLSCPVLFVGLRDRNGGPPMCADCAAVRADSDGERWFCAAHAGDRVSLRAFAPSTTSIGGGPLL